MPEWIENINICPVTMFPTRVYGPTIQPRSHGIYIYIELQPYIHTTVY
jgi:hypothetical protein